MKEEVSQGLPAPTPSEVKHGGLWPLLPAIEIVFETELVILLLFLNTQNWSVYNKCCALVVGLGVALIILGVALIITGAFSQSPPVAEPRDKTRRGE